MEIVIAGYGCLALVLVGCISVWAVAGIHALMHWRQHAK